MMFGILKSKILAGVGLTVVLAMLSLFLWGTSWRSDAREWQSKWNSLSHVAGDVLVNIRLASDNPDLALTTAAEQVSLLGASRKAWMETAQLQSSRIDALGNETARLKALNSALRAKAEVAILKRNGAIKRLGAMALTPGERADCARQLFEAEAALDLVYREGL